MIFFLAWLVAIGATEETSFFCMMKGHTYCRIDQSFRTLIWRLMGVPVWTVSALLRYLMSFLHTYGCRRVIELHALWDWKGYFAPHIHERFSGFATGQHGSGMHEFMLRKGSDGHVRFWFRKSSRASWLPEGDGYLVFNTIPEGKPKLAKAKAEHEWSGSTVISTVRQWYRFIANSTSPTDETKIRTEWEQRFENLPPEGDTDQLALSFKPVWQDLPRFKPVRTGTISDSFVSDEMENPPVNPVTGPGRTAAEVAREVAEYRARIRDEDSSHPPLFQADFVFAIPPGGSLGLHRVAHGACLYRSTAAEIAFTTVEYQHHSQEGFDGFWGTFTQQTNSRYDPKDRKTGGKFVRHQEMTRREVKLYDVRTFLDGGKIRVSTDSLSSLSKVSNAQRPTPAELPESHQRNSSGRQGSSRRTSASRAGTQRRAPQRSEPQRSEDASNEGSDDDSGEDGGRQGSSRRTSASRAGTQRRAPQRSEPQRSEDASNEGSNDDSGEDGGEEEQQGQQHTEKEAPTRSRVHLQMEIQGCDPEVCEMVCTDCDWEPCVVTADHVSSCNVRLLEVVDDVDPICLCIANRFLRWPAAAISKRRRLQT